jgi:hypothetical protein
MLLELTGCSSDEELTTAARKDGGAGRLLTAARSDA